MTFSKRERWTSLMVEYRDYIGCFAFAEKKRFFVGGLLRSMASSHSIENQ